MNKFNLFLSAGTGLVIAVLFFVIAQRVGLALAREAFGFAFAVVAAALAGVWLATKAGA